MNMLKPREPIAPITASPKNQAAACFPHKSVFGRIGKQIDAYALLAASKADGAAETDTETNTETQVQKQKPIPSAYQHISSAVACRVLEHGGWDIPKGSVIPPYTQLPPLSVIGRDCVFGHHCTLLDHCTVGSDCVFGEACSFIGLPAFGDRCVFAGHCEFTAGAKFGDACVFGPVPLFNFDTKFGAYCSFPVGTDWSEFGLKFGVDCVGAPVAELATSIAAPTAVMNKGAIHAH